MEKKKEEEKENIINKIISNEEKSSSNDLMTSNTNEKNKNNIKNEQKISSSLISPTKDDNIKDVKILENDNADSLPPPSSYNPNQGKKSKKGIFKRIFS